MSVAHHHTLTAFSKEHITAGLLSSKLARQDRLGPRRAMVGGE
jgi:hypothetical protein